MDTDRVVNASVVEFLRFLRHEVSVERSLEQIRSILGRSAFTEQQAFRLLAMQIPTRPMTSLEQEQAVVTAAANAIVSTGKAILRALPQSRTEFQTGASIWINALETDRRSALASRHTTVSLEVTWWAACYFSWRLAGGSQVPSHAFFWANQMKRAGLERHSAEKYLVALLGTTEHETHRRLIAVKAVRDDDLIQPNDFMAAVRELAVNELDAAIMAVLQGETRSITAWWKNQRVKPPTAHAATESSSGAQAARIVETPRKRTPPSASNAKATINPLTVGPLIHRLQLKGPRDRALRGDLCVILEVLWRNRYVGSLTVSASSLKNLLRSRTMDEMSLSNLETCLACLERMKLLVPRRKSGDAIALAASPETRTGHRIMEKLKVRFPR